MAQNSKGPVVQALVPFYFTVQSSSSFRNRSVARSTMAMAPEKLREDSGGARYGSHYGSPYWWLRRWQPPPLELPET